MTQEEAKMRAELYSALAEGKTIQVKDTNGTWKDVKIEELNKIYSSDNYRVKPESKYRPFKDKKECWNEMLKHYPFGWVMGKMDDHFYHIDFVYSCDPDNGYGVRLSKEAINTNYEHMFRDFKFADGKPFGIKEE